MNLEKKLRSYFLVRSRSGILIPAVDSLLTSGLDTIPAVYGRISANLFIGFLYIPDF